MPIQLSGSLVITGSITTTGVITMSGSIASASYSSTSDLLQGTGSVGFATTASLLAVSSSQQQISSSLLNVIAIGATTGSNSFRADQSITGSLVVSSTITAQTLVVQTVTSSIVYSSGSNNFGNQLNNIQTFTGSLNITGSITQTGANATASFASSVGIGTNTILNRLTLSGGSDGLTNMLGVYNDGINNTTAIGKGSAIILGGNTDGNYSAKIAMVYEGQNPSYLQPALTFHTMNNTFAYGSEVERMRITSMGNVGIGTCTPTGTYGKLTVAGGISILDDNNAKFEIGRYSSSVTSSYIKIGTNSTSLKITNAADTTDLVSFLNTGSVFFGSIPSFTNYMKYNFNVGTDLNIGFRSSGGVSRLETTNDAVSANTPMEFAASRFNMVGGNVGIATACPTQLLQLGDVSVITQDANSMYVGTNFGNGTGGNYIKSQYANQIHFDSATGNINFKVAGSGVAANAITYSTAMILTSTGQVTKPCSAAFHAAINSSTCIGPGGRVIQFNCVIYNAGGGYNGTTSTFTAPVSGMYQFNFTFLNQNVQNVDGGHAYLSTNYGGGTYYFTRYGCFSGTDRTGYGNYVPMHGAIAVYLPAGCKACVAAFWDGDGAFTHNSTAWSNFTGYLVG